MASSTSRSRRPSSAPWPTKPTPAINGDIPCFLANGDGPPINERGALMSALFLPLEMQFLEACPRLLGNEECPHFSGAGCPCCRGGCSPRCVQSRGHAPPGKPRTGAHPE